MCFSCPPSNVRLCFACGNDHASTESRSAPVPARRISPASLSTAPVEITHHIIGFNPGSVLTLGRVSREFQRFARDFLPFHTADVFRECASGNTNMHHIVHMHHIRHALREQHIVETLRMQHTIDTLRGMYRGSQSSLTHTDSCHPCDSQTEADSVHHFPLITHRLLVMLHASITNSIRSFGVIACPDTLLAPNEVNRLCHEVQNLQDVNLRRMWGPLRNQMMAANPFLEFVPIPESGETPHNLRSWMNRITLLGSFDGGMHLYGQNLTSVPLELRSFNGLQALGLENNQLASLPVRIFQGMTSLQRLDLSNNRLAFLPGGAFEGLSGLQELYLEDNQLVSLPAGLFQGLTSLKGLGLANNRLISLPEQLFQEQEGLRGFFLTGNPRLLFFYHDLPVENNLSCLGAMQEFYHYRCKSAFAGFYRLAAATGSPEDVREAFDRLDSSLKNAIYGMVWVEAGCPNTGDPQWGEHHAFDDMQIFYGALKRHVKESFEALSQEEKNAVYYHVYHLAKSEGLDVDSVPAWGEIHALDNILRLIDAMAERMR